MTYKILYNDAVAMTGGQHHDGPLDPAMISRQIAAEGVAPIVVVTDEPEKYPAGINWAPGVTIRHRDELDAVQRELREKPGVSALIYDQTCATEKRRRRKRNEFPDPAKRVVINELVCEGCGDCSVKSNCLSVEPLETEFGRKRTINQSTCNKDYSCLKGFCPSFVTVEGGKLKKGKSATRRREGRRRLSRPARSARLPDLQDQYGMLVTGIGGTGVITIGQILGMAAHLEGKGVSVLDMSGLAQKYGAVMSHVKIAASPEQLHVGAPRHRRRAPGARLRPGGDRQRRRARQDARAEDARAGERHHLADRRVREEPELAAAGQRPDARHPRSLRRQERRFRPRRRARHRADGRLDRHQHVHARLRLAEGLGAARPRSDRARDRAERRRGRVQQAGLRLGPARGGRPRARPAHRHPGRSDPDRAALLAQSRGAGRAPREFLTGYQDAAYASALQESRRSAREAESGKAGGKAHRGGRALLRQAARLQGRVRGRAPVHRRRIPQEDRGHVRGRLQAHVPPRAAAARQTRSAHRRADEDRSSARG